MLIKYSHQLVIIDIIKINIKFSVENQQMCFSPQKKFMPG